MIDASEKRQCVKCNQEKPLTDFQRRSDRPHQFRTECRACTSTYVKQWKKDRPDLMEARNQRRLPYHREHWTKRRMREFGLTPEAYAALLRQQGGVCALCGKPETTKGARGETRSLAIDHDHKTGKVRGLLCFLCNTRLAILEDESFVSAANAYITRSQ